MGTTNVKTASVILHIKSPGELFSDSLNAIKSEYAELAKIWHPDVNKDPQADKVMSHINQLYNEALNLLNSGKWISPDTAAFKSTKGKWHNIRYITAHEFELGTAYIGNKVVAYVVDKEYKDLFNNAKKIITNFKFASDRMKSEVSRYLPVILDDFETSDSLCLVLKKTPDLVLLRDVLEYFNGVIPDHRHVAWIQSSLYNLSCYLEYAGLSHNAISPDAYFISPPLHGGALLGGWWYAVPTGSRITNVPVLTYEVMPPSVKRSKIGSIRTDLELIQANGRELLGDRNGSRLKSMTAAPDPLINWLRSTTPSTAVETYTAWSKVLDEAYGKRRFIPLELTANMIYK